MSVEEARQAYADTMQRMMQGESPELTQGFQFELSEGDQRDPDESIMRQETTTEAGGEQETTTTEDGG